MAPLARPLHVTRPFDLKGGPMTSGMFGDTSTSAIYEAMQGLWEEQQSVANNVANIDTPNYKAKDVNFETSLAQAIANGDPSQMQVTTTDSTAPSDQAGNNVDLGSEMVQGETAGMQFQTMVDAMNAKFQLLSTAINGPSSSAG
jgi:flagellar basal-body rod protein FlgB